MLKEEYHSTVNETKSNTIIDKTIRVLKKNNILAAVPFLLPSIMGFMAFTFIPIIATLLLSFFNWSLLDKPSFVGLDNFIQLFTNDPSFIKVVINTFYYVSVYLILNIIFAIGLAVWLTQQVKGLVVFRALMFFPVLIPPVAIALIWQWIYDKNNGLFNIFLEWIGIQGPNWLGDIKFAMLALIIATLWQYVGYNMLIFMAAIKGIPPSLYEAASLDGAGFIAKFKHVTLPLLTPAIFFAGVMTLINTFQTFDLVFALTNGGPGQSTEILGLYVYNNAFMWFKMGYGSSIAVVMFIFILIITILQLKFQKRWVHYE
ncbi:carbohydrate ABC transporter permease [Bacillus sp. REN16]|uniref:carbohydrate ABC transporter permease n=1 Tax=Bacillus sp. REN16 TaxID=2887296 RepID=UPI001E4C2069|nr:sugar ABC transporter permease [Bacillus sp. REN16]MCC3358942.1 sugar ABC transporter permease [Bacillus sp. REN16]